MLYYKLNKIRFIVLEVARLEGLIGQFAKSRDYEKKREFEENLKSCRALKAQLISENLLDQLYLRPSEKIMAENYFYKGMNWNPAFNNSPLYDRVGEEEDAYEKAVGNSRRAILRAAQIFYKQ